MMLADCKSILGEKKEAESLLSAAMKLNPGNGEQMLFAAEIYEHHGKRELALHWVSEAIKHGYALENIEHSAGLKELRKDPRFKKAVSP
jgi:TPR repeat protein